LFEFVSSAFPLDGSVEFVLKQIDHMMMKKKMDDPVEEEKNTDNLPQEKAPPPTTFLELLPTLDQWERDLFDTCQFLVPYHEVLQMVCTEPIVFASDGGAASPKASFGWVMSTNQGQPLIDVSGPAHGAHSNSYQRATGFC